MATDQGFVEHLQSQSGLGHLLSFRKMFGEYALYLHGKVVAFAAWVCVAGLFVATPAAAIESSALGLVEPLSTRIRQIFTCGDWSSPPRSGFFRVVLVDVNGGAGSEVYVQRIEATVVGADQRLTLLETTPIHQLNDDHAQYQVSRAKCIGSGRRSAVELVATFEHDEDDISHRIRISLAPVDLYRVNDIVVRPKSGKTR